MLERVAVHHLESGGLRLLQGGRPRKRTLHSVFWPHSIGEFGLVNAASSLLGGGRSGGCDAGRGGEDALPPETTMAPQPQQQQQTQHSNLLQRRADLIHLDFLYPSGALAFVRHLSGVVLRRDSTTAFSLGGGTREFSSTSQLPTPSTENRGVSPTTSGPWAETLQPIPMEPTPGRPEGDIYKGFNHFQTCTPGGEYESAWFHYAKEWRRHTKFLASPQANSDLGSQLRKEFQNMRRYMAEYLLRSSHRLEWTRLIAMVTACDPNEWSSSDYETLVACLLRLGQPGQALDVLKRNVNTCPYSRDSGFEIFMRHYIMVGRWDMVMAAYGQLRAVRDRSSGKRDRRYHLNTTAMPSLRDPASSTAYIRTVLNWASSVPLRSPSRSDRLRGDLARDLVEGSVNYITRPEATWSDTLFDQAWTFMKKRWYVSKPVWERALGYLAGNRQDAEAIKLYATYRQLNPQRMELNVMNKILLCYARQQDFMGMQMLFEDILIFSDVKKPNIWTFSILMAAVAKMGHADAVHKLLTQSFALHPPQHPQELNHIMQAYVEQGDIDNVVSWFDRISSEYGLMPDVISYNTLINAYSRVGDVDGAAARVQEMLDHGLKPDQTTYNIILNMCARRGDISGAENTFDLIVQSGFEPSTYSYQALAAAYIAAKDVAKADALLEHISDRTFDQSPTPIWNTIIAAHAANGNDERVSDIFKVMHDKGIPFDYYTYGIVMHSLCTAGKMEAAEETLSFIKESGFHISADKYAILMVGYTRLGNFRKVWETFQMMLDDGLKADFNTLAVLLKAYAHSEVEGFLEIQGNMVHLKSTEEMLDQVTTEVRELDLNSFDPIKTATPPWLFTPLINVYSKKEAWDRAINVFDRFLEVSGREKNKGAPNIQMYKSMMQVYRGGGDIEGVQSMWQGLKAAALRQHKSIDLRKSNRKMIVGAFRNELCGALSIFIRAMGEVKDIDSIKAEIDSIQKSGYDLDNVNWNDYVQALALAGLLQEATLVCERNLMANWNILRLYFFYSDASMRGDGVQALPAVRPFVRTIETIATELKQLDEMRKAGDEEAKALLVEVFRNAPATWEACDGLENMENRVSKEMMFRLYKSRGVVVGGSSTGGAGAGYY